VPSRYSQVDTSIESTPSSIVSGSTGSTFVFAVRVDVVDQPPDPPER
jgi:hypothetical protein